jgi:hypothetical protein
MVTVVIAPVVSTRIFGVLISFHQRTVASSSSSWALVRRGVRKYHQYCCAVHLSFLAVPLPQTQR